MFEVIVGNHVTLLERSKHFLHAEDILSTRLFNVSYVNIMQVVTLVVFIDSGLWGNYWKAYNIVKYQHYDTANGFNV